MALLADFGFHADSIIELAQQAKASGKSYINVTIAINDEYNDKGKNVYMYLQQTKEQVQAKEKKHYVGVGGKTFWTNGKVPDTAPKANNPAPQTTSNASFNPFGAPASKPSASTNDDLPF